MSPPPSTRASFERPLQWARRHCGAAQVERLQPRQFADRRRRLLWMEGYGVLGIGGLFCCAVVHAHSGPPGRGPSRLRAV